MDLERKDYFLYQFKQHETNDLVERYSNVNLCEEAYAAIFEILIQRGVSEQEINSHRKHSQQDHCPDSPNHVDKVENAESVSGCLVMFRVLVALMLLCASAFVGIALWATRGGRIPSGIIYFWLLTGVAAVFIVFWPLNSSSSSSGKK